MAESAVVSIVPTTAPSRAASSGLSSPASVASSMAIWKSCSPDEISVMTWMRSFSAAGKSAGIRLTDCASTSAWLPVASTAASWFISTPEVAAAHKIVPRAAKLRVLRSPVGPGKTMVLPSKVVRVYS